jgi:hypothetical protein
MRRRLKLLTTSVLLASFAVLTGARTVRSLQSINLIPYSSLSAPRAALSRHVTLEVPSGAFDIKAPQDWGITLTESHFSMAPPPPAPEYVFIAPGLFWTGRILRRIVSAEPDGH